MNQTELDLYIHRKEFEVRCCRNRGTAFQTFFEDIMVKHDPSFQRVRSWGDAGDWKCDGFSQATCTVYQCYAPDGITIEKTVKKIQDDFHGAKLKWGSQMKRWVFVWSDHEALPPHVVQVIHQLKAANPDVMIEDWSTEALWKIVEGVSDADRTYILGAVPRLSDVTETTAAEVQVLLNYLVRQDITVLPNDLSMTELATKIDRNRLSKYVSAMVGNALPVARVVDSYVKKAPDPMFSATVASALAGQYRALAVTGNNEPDRVFGDLVKYVAHGWESPKLFWAAVGIVTYYFQLCDIFER